MPPLEELDAAVTPNSSWLKADLLEYALTMGLPVSESMTKSEILAAIDAA